jgi:hypothetical protein
MLWRGWIALIAAVKRLPWGASAEDEIMRFAKQGACGLFVASALVAAASTSAAAEERFSLKPLDGGFVRLDTQTGHTSICTGTLEALVCRSAPDERAALDAEIVRLTADNERLKAASGGLPSAKVEFNLPSDAEVDKAMTFLEKLVKRFRSMVDDLHRDPGNQTPL